jgi:hypothetical protein
LYGSKAIKAERCLSVGVWEYYRGSYRNIDDLLFLEPFFFEPFADG